MTPDKIGNVGVDTYSRYRVIEDDFGLMRVAVERYPWPYRHPLKAVRAALDVARWHVDVIRQHGWREWKHLRAF